MFQFPSVSRRALSVLTALVTLVCLAGEVQAKDWILYTDETSTRLVADAAVGSTDTFEKDLATADVDKDGDIDLVVARKVRFSNAGGKANVLFMNEGGVMTDRTSTLAPDMLDVTDDRDVIFVDVDGDTWLDMVTATTFDEQPRLYMNLGEDGSGTWLGFDLVTGRLPTFTPGPKFCAVVAGDVNGDDAPDLFFVDYSNTLEDRLLINNGSGTFTDETATRMTAAMSQSAFGTDAQIIDMNGDGARDIVKLSTLSDSPNSVRILYNAGGANLGTFNFMQHAYQGSPYMMEVADFNKDGRPDIYVVDDGRDAYLLNTGNDAQGRAPFDEIDVGGDTTTSFAGNTVVADLNRDGNLDVLVADVDTDFEFCDRFPFALRNRGDVPSITLEDPLNDQPRTWLPEGTFDFAVFDINGDDYPDIWAGTCTGNKIFLGTPNDLFLDGFESGNTSAWSVVTP